MLTLRWGSEGGTQSWSKWSGAGGWQQSPLWSSSGQAGRQRGRQGSHLKIPPEAWHCSQGWGQGLCQPSRSRNAGDCWGSRHIVHCLRSEGPARPQPFSKVLSPCHEAGILVFSSGEIGKPEWTDPAPHSLVLLLPWTCCATWGKFLSSGVPIHQRGNWPCFGYFPHPQPSPRFQFGLELERDLEVHASFLFTDGETEAMKGTLPPALCSS